MQHWVDLCSIWAQNHPVELQHKKKKTSMYVFYSNQFGRAPSHIVPVRMYVLMKHHHQRLPELNA